MKNRLIPCHVPYSIGCVLGFFRIWLFAYQIFSRHFHSVSTSRSCENPCRCCCVSFIFRCFFFKKYQHESSLKPNESLFDVGLFNSMKIWYVHKYYASHCHSLELVLSFIGEWWSLCMCVIKRHDLVLNNVDNDDYVNDML